MQIIRAHSGVPIRLTEERWRHIANRHPEVLGLRDQVLETLSEPDIIQEGDYGELLAVREYERSGSSRFVVVVYREVGPRDGFILTAYISGRCSSKRKTIWKR